MLANTISSDEPLHSNAFFEHSPISCKINSFKFHLIQSHIIFCRVSSYPTCKSSISLPHMHNHVKTKVLHHLQVVNNIYFKFMLSFVGHNMIWGIKTLSWEFESNLSFIFSKLPWKISNHICMVSTIEVYRQTIPMT